MSEETIHTDLETAVQIIADRGLGERWGTRKPIPRSLALRLAPHWSEDPEDCDAEALVNAAVAAGELLVEEPA